ncbi:MAG: zinc ribbon domain-containing protein [Candidatus Hodarchaeota archaeon]
MEWDLFKRTYPYVCDSCGYFHWEKKLFCEGCGSKNTVRKITKKDWKRYKLNETLAIKNASISG